MSTERRGSFAVSSRTLVLTVMTSMWLFGVAVQVAASLEDFDLPGTQPACVGVDCPPVGAQIQHLFIAPENAANSCSVCHAGDPEIGRPLDAWQGSMMSQAARDPLFYAQLDLAVADPAVRPEVDGMADMCLRCHSPAGWLEGRSTQLDGMLFNEKDMFGVQCHVCHRMVDPELLADPTHHDTVNILSPLDSAFGVPPTFGNGMFVMDPKHTRRGPYDESELTAHGFSYVGTDILWSSLGDVGVDSHPVRGSEFHRSGNLCGTCHDVSNPTDCLPGFDGEDTQKCFPIERTWSEWKNSSYASMGEQGNCQSCHMSGPLNGVAVGEPCEGSALLGHLNDIHFHDLTGGNAFVPLVIKDFKQRYETATATLCGADPICVAEENNFKAAIDALYPPAGSSPFVGVDPAALDAGIERVQRTLRRAAFVTPTAVSPDLVVRIDNRTGHKLPTGYPEGRRMWLNVRFLDALGNLLAESGRYDPATAALFHDQNLDGLVGSLSYDVLTYTDAAGSSLAIGRPTKVWEARVDYQPAVGAPVEFHFTLNNHVEMDNRIPPDGWSPAGYAADRAMPVIPALYSSNGWQGDYQPGGTPISHDEVAYPVPPGTDRVELELLYQTASREYIEALVADNPNTLVGGGYNRGTLMQEGWERNGRSSPASMSREVVAVLDGDGDGLSDGWEAEFLGAAPVGERGYNDDPDADGRPNWQEFQDGSHPMDAASPMGAVVREPVDIVLVLDVSGSMNDAAPGSSTAKIDILRDSVTLFLETWRDYATPEDRIGVVFFGTNAEQYGVGSLLKNFVAEWENIRNEVQDPVLRPAGGWTAMGAGLHTAIVGLGAFDPLDPRKRHVLLFSNGMQNRSPMVTVDPLDAFPDHLYIKDQTQADNPDVTGNSNVVIGGTNYLIPLAASELVHVHTVGIGVAENSGGTAWHQLLFDLANQQSGKHNFITFAAQLDGVFLEDLVEALRGNTPEYVMERRVELSQAQTIEFPINGSAERFTLAITWDDQENPPRVVSLTRPDGEQEDARRISRGGARYQIITRYLTDADAAPGEFGMWKLVLEADPDRREVDDAVGASRKRTAATVHVMVEDAELKYTFSVSARRARIGEALRVTSSAQHGDRFLRGLESVTVELMSPQRSVGDALARSKSTAQDGAFDPDLASSPFGSLLAGSFAGDEFVRSLALKPSAHGLLDDGLGGDELAGDGIFSAMLPTPTVPGHYRLRFTMRGALGDGRPFSREETRDVLVGIGVLDPGRSKIRRANDHAVFTPRDADGNLLGPGYHDQIVALVNNRRLTVEDQLDGSYRVVLPAGLGPSNPLRLVHQGGAFFEGVPQDRSLGDRLAGLAWWVWLLLLLLLLLLVGLWLRRP